MFLSFAPRRPDPRPFNFLGESLNLFTDMGDFVTPVTFYTTSGCPGRAANTNRGPLKKRISQEAESAPVPVTAPVVKKARFEMEVDIEGFKPEELNVKLVDNCLTIRGNHESTDDHGGIVSRTFTRKCTIPDDVNLEEMTCNLHSLKGHIVISAPRRIEQPPIKETVIPINFQENLITEKSDGGEPQSTLEHNESLKDDGDNEKDSKMAKPMAA